jgi:hypothetical protein
MRHEVWLRRLPAFAAALGLVGVLAACGGGSGGGGTAPTVVPPAPVRTLIGTTGFNVLGLDAANRAGLERDEALASLVVNQAGTLEIIVDWTFASNDVDIHLYSGTCTSQQIVTTGCSIIARADSVNLKPERLTVSVQPGTYAIGVANFGRGNESGTVQTFLTR